MSGPLADPMLVLAEGEGAGDERLAEAVRLERPFERSLRGEVRAGELRLV